MSNFLLITLNKNGKLYWKKIAQNKIKYISRECECLVYTRGDVGGKVLVFTEPACVWAAPPEQDIVKGDATILPN